MGARLLENEDIDKFIPELKKLDDVGYVEEGPVDELRKEIELRVGYPIARSLFFRLIKYEMAERYIEKVLNSKEDSNG